MAQTVKNLPAKLETGVRSLGLKDPLEKGMATHSNILAWRTPWTEGIVCNCSLVGYSPWGSKESDVTELFSLSLSRFGGWKGGEIL